MRTKPVRSSSCRISRARLAFEGFRASGTRMLRVTAGAVAVDVRIALGYHEAPEPATPRVRPARRSVIRSARQALLQEAHEVPTEDRLQDRAFVAAPAHDLDECRIVLRAGEPLERHEVG